MGIAYIKEDGFIRGVAHFDDIFEFKGFKFRFRFGGWTPPEQLRKDGQPRKENTKAFWDAWEEFCLLPKEEQKTYMIEEE